MQTRTGAEDRAKVTSILCKARGVIWKRFPSTIRPVSLSLKMTTTMNETLAPAWWEYHLDVAAPPLLFIIHILFPHTFGVAYNAYNLNARIRPRTAVRIARATYRRQLAA